MNKLLVFKAPLEKSYQIIKEQACRFFGIRENTEISFESSGKPYFKDYKQLHFNLSHSDIYLAVAFSDSPVGVDIEKHREINLKIAERYFTPNERKTVKNSRDFFYVWTRKEACLKKTGEGLRGLKFCDTSGRTDIKTFDEKDFTLSVCCDTARDFKLIYEENFQWQP